MSGCCYNFPNCEHFKAKEPVDAEFTTMPRFATEASPKRKKPTRNQAKTKRRKGVPGY